MIDGISTRYSGMVCNITNKPDGFGRAIDLEGKRFYDG